MRFSGKLLSLLFLVLLFSSIAYAYTEKTKIVVVFDGATPISAGLTTKATYAEKESYLKQEINATMAKESYTYSVTKNSAKTDIQIEKFKCKSDTCWYWI